MEKLILNSKKSKIMVFIKGRQYERYNWKWDREKIEKFKKLKNGDELWK